MNKLSRFWIKCIAILVQQKPRKLAVCNICGVEWIADEMKKGESGTYMCNPCWGLCEEENKC